MSKTRTFVSYGSVVSGGVRQLIHRTAITPGTDPVTVGSASNLSAAQFTTYLVDLVAANTLVPSSELNTASRDQITALVNAQIAGLQTGKANKIKVALQKTNTLGSLLITQTTNGVKSSTSINLVPST